MRMYRPVTVAALTLTIAIFAGGCSPEEDLSTKEPKSGSTASPSESREPSASSGWKTASVKLAQIQVPSEWTISSSADQTQIVRAPKDSIGLSPGSGKIVAGPHAGDGDDESAVNALAELREVALANDLQNLKRLPNEAINGSIFYHFRGEDEHTWQDHFGTVLPGGDDRVTISWDFTKADIDRKGAEALIAQIMPTYKPL